MGGGAQHVPRKLSIPGGGVTDLLPVPYTLTVSGGWGAQHVPRKLSIRDGGVADLLPVPYYGLLLASGDTSLHFLDVSRPPRSIIEEIYFYFLLLFT